MHAFRSADRVLLRLEASLVATPIERVVRFEAGASGVRAVLAPEAGGGVAPVRNTLGELEERFGSDFVRIQRAHLVNAAWIGRFDALGDGRVEAVLANGERIVASRAVSIELRRAAL